MTTGNPTCPICKASGITLKYPTMTKLNPLSPLKLFTKALSGKFAEQKVICPKCGYKGPYGIFFDNIKSLI